MNQAISKQGLLNYIEREQVAFQYCDGLLKFTHPETNQYDFDSDRDDAMSLKPWIEGSQSLKVINPKGDYHKYSHKYNCYCDFIDWSTKKDLLVLVDDSLLLCISKNGNYKEIFG